VAAQLGAEAFNFGVDRFAHRNGDFYNRTEGVVLNARFDQGILLYNPAAGRIRSRPALVDEAFEALHRLAGSITRVATEGPGTAGRQAAEAVAAGADLVLVAGGDGTVNEALQGLAGTHAALGIIPAGTANVTAMEIGLGKRNSTALPGLLRSEPVRIAVGALEAQGAPERYFLAMAGAGLDASIVRRVAPSFKMRFGKLSYWYAGFATLGQALPEFNAVVGGRRVRASFALLSRVKNYGGDLEIARHADILQPKLALAMFEGRSSFRYLKYFSGVLANRLNGMTGVSLELLDEFTVEAEPGGGPDLQVDGEYAGQGAARIRIVPDSLNLLVPRR
jgi:diacylglycerol kinase family enzyme